MSRQAWEEMRRMPRVMQGRMENPVPSPEPAGEEERERGGGMREGFLCNDSLNGS